MDELTLKGERYISSKRAAEVTGYTKDYVGQLCRAEKIDARLVGRNWYVNERSILAHKKRGRLENTHKTDDTTHQFVETSRYITGSAAESPYYKKDSRPLIPDPIKQPELQEEKDDQKTEEDSTSRPVELKMQRSSAEKSGLRRIQKQVQIQAGASVAEHPVSAGRREGSERRLFVFLPFSIAACFILVIIGLLSLERVERYENASGRASVNSSYLQFAEF